MHIRRIALLVMDSVGIGELPDSCVYHDQGSDTLGNIARALGGLFLPHLARLGLGNITPIPGISPAEVPLGAYGKMAERSPGKDTTTGHWELVGVILDRPFPTYPNGFPPELIHTLEERWGRKVLGNKAASGTKIIAELGEEHLCTGNPIVYTSADSVLQIAAHEAVIPVPELYNMCRIAREVCTGEHGVARIIARPFTGTPGNFTRTAARRDFSLAPVKPTVLDSLVTAGQKVYGVGKIEDIFAGRGITDAIHTSDNAEGLTATRRLLYEDFSGLIFTNLVDFDMLYGHRNDIAGYARALGDFDRFLPELLAALRDNDVLIITADHGCDPTTPSTDHSREYVPLLVYGQAVRPGTNLGVRSSFADVGATIAHMLGVLSPGTGTSFYPELRSQK